MQPSAELAPEVVVGDRYRLLESLASGGTASVWRAEDTRLGRDVAVKVLQTHDLDPALRTRAEREATVLASLDHPNLVRVFDTGVDEGVPFIVMELLEGEPLSTIIASRGALLVDEAVGLVADVADGLGAAHACGVVHRDVKPGNIVCRESNRVPTLVDFGIAKSVDATTLTRGLVVGTASYIAPEQAQGLPVSPAGDVYALGCVLYELLAGSPPFQGDSPVAIAVKHVNEDPVAPSDRVAGIPAAVDAVVLRCLAKDPALRPDDGAGLATALRAALASPPGDETTAIDPIPAPDTTMVMPAIAADSDIIDPSPLPPVPAPTASSASAMRSPMLAAAVLAAIVLGAILIAVADRTADATRPVPDVTNASVQDATAYLEGAGFEVDVEPIADEAVPAGVVIASEPGAGQTLGDGGTVTLSVSTGPTATTAPPPPDDEKDDDDESGRGRGKKGDD